MKAIFKLFILNLLALALLPSCSDDDQSNSEQNDPVSGNISPVGSFSVEATNNENELLVKWTNPSNRDVDMVENSLTGTWKRACLVLPTSHRDISSYR